MTFTDRYRQLQEQAAYRRRIAAFGPAAAIAPYRATVAPRRGYSLPTAVAVALVRAEREVEAA